MSIISKIFKPRLPLFTKIVISFVFITVFMVISSIFLLLQLKEAFTSAITGLESYEMRSRLSKELEILFEEIYHSINQYALTKDQLLYENYIKHHEQFISVLDSLFLLSKDEELKFSLKQVNQVYTSYFNSVSKSFSILPNNPKFDINNELKNQTDKVDTIRNGLREILNIHHHSLSKELRVFDRRVDVASNGAFVTLLLSIIIAIGTSIVLARTFTKPINALKAGTERVGEGHYETIIATSNDEIADLAKAFNTMSDKLKKLDEMRVELMSEISHEMRTPLQVIKAGCHTVVHSKDSAKLSQRQMDAIAIIQQATNRINSFVNHFLDIAKMEAGLMKFNFSNLNIVELLVPLIEEAKLVAQTRQIKVSLITEDKYILRVDKDKISQVFTNLLSNALKYTPNNGSIEIRVSKFHQYESNAVGNRPMVKIDVKDSGVGIPESDLKKLFSKFYQAKNIPVVNEKGSGLGLTLVKYITEAHGGKVLVESQVGVGSTFSVLLPALLNNELIS